MKKIDHFTNQYSLSKTLRFKLVPEGKTYENFINDRQLETDEQRAEEYKKVKKMLDLYHRDFIDRALVDFTLPHLDEYVQLYRKAKRSPEDEKALDDITKKMYKAISDRFSKVKPFSEEKKKLFGKEAITELLANADFLSEEDKTIVSHFNKFTTYFTGFNDNRENMYTGEGKSTEIAFRIVEQNLPKFLDNCKIGTIARDFLEQNELQNLDSVFSKLFSFDVTGIFETEHFNHVLCQAGIDEYNQLIGGYTNEDGIKIQGYNELINLYNQKNKTKYPKLKPLYKQILSDRTTLSFIPEQFENSQDLLTSVNDFYNIRDNETGYSIKSVLDELSDIFNNFGAFDLSGIFVPNGPAITDLSNKAFGNWNVITGAWENQYDENVGKNKKQNEKYFENRKNALKRIPSFNLEELQEYGYSVCKDVEDALVTYAQKECRRLLETISTCYDKAFSLLNNPYPVNEKINQNNDEIGLIKDFLDSIKDFQHFCKLFTGTGKEENKDEYFYGKYMPLCDQLDLVTPLYNKVRNFMTQKPYSDDKIKLNFDNPQLLGGWDKNKESAYRTVILNQDKNYYLGIMSKENSGLFANIPEASDGDSVYRKMIYKLLPGPNKMLPKVFISAKKNLDYYKPSAALLNNYANGTHLLGADFNLDHCHALIDYYKDCINLHEDWCKFDFEFRDTTDYRNISEFYNDVKNQGYKVTFEDVPASFIDKAIEDGKLYLFKIYNKDFSDYSKGTPNLHTMYFNALFDKDNLKDVVYALNGGAEMFYRQSSIAKDKAVVHKAGDTLNNKNPLNPKTTSVFQYDIIKDRRYTDYQFSFHVPIKLNFKAPDRGNINEAVQHYLRECKNNYVIGIDRGERNLLYVSVLDGNGNIVEQFSLNQIINEYNGQKIVTDYHSALDKQEKERLNARQSWTTVENIKELKEGYISQVVHKICELVEKYDAVIAMEDLNSGFKNSRIKVEKQVYQKFEKMLIDKLNYYVNKKANIKTCGGLLHAYQLTNKFQSFKAMGKQNGFIFYIPAWLTSKIDPTTGFVDLLKPRYESVEKAKVFFGSFDNIYYDQENDYFVFDLDYRKFPGTDADYKKKWQLCTYGNRILTFRNPDKNHSFDNKEINLTEAYKELFAKYRIDYRNDLYSQILSVSTADFYRELISLTKLMLQMRNSVTGTDIDYLISPVKNKYNRFYCSNDIDGYDCILPCDADANGAYHIGRKAQWAIERICNPDADNKLAIKNKEWLEYVQK